jgi:hypothetical protein
LKKRSKKLLFVWSRAGPTGAAPRSKSFLVLFFKKEHSSFNPSGGGLQGDGAHGVQDPHGPWWQGK